MEKNKELCIVFDLFRVLVVTEWENVVPHILQDQKEFAPLFLNFFKSKYWAAYQRGTLSYRRLELCLPKMLPVKLLKKLINEMPFYASILPGMFNLLLALKREGYRLYLLTNVVPQTFFVFQRRFSFMGLFDGKLPSFEAKALKPEKIIYQKMFAKFNLVPGQCLLIDDHKENVKVAKSLGMEGIVYVDCLSLEAEFKKMGVL